MVDNVQNVTTQPTKWNKPYLSGSASLNMTLLFSNDRRRWTVLCSPSLNIFTYSLQCKRISSIDTNSEPLWFYHNLYFKWTFKWIFVTIFSACSLLCILFEPKSSVLFALISIRVASITHIIFLSNVDLNRERSREKNYNKRMVSRDIWIYISLFFLFNVFFFLFWHITKCDMGLRFRYSNCTSVILNGISEDY